MRNILRTTALAAALLAALPAAQAATQSYTFSGMMDSNHGYYAGETFSGQFSFDDAGLTSIGEEYLGVGSFSMSFLNNIWTLTHTEAATEVKFSDGVFAGLSYAATQGGTGFSVISGYADTSDSFVAYTTTLDLSGAGAGSIIYAAVPEPETYALFLAGLGLMALRRRQQH